MSPGVPAEIAQLGTILGVWAHPDDESFMSAGVMSLAIANGQTVACITATKGEAGLQDASRWSLENMGQVREDELAAAFKILGINNHHWLDYLDGHCHEISDADGSARVLDYIEKYVPDTIITFPPNGITGHDDHRAVSRWSKNAIQKSGRQIRLLYGINTTEQYEMHLKAADQKFNIYFNIDKPVFIPQAKCDYYFSLPAEITQRKIAALKAMPSQTAAMFEDPDHGWLEGALCCEAFVLAERDDIDWG